MSQNTICKGCGASFPRQPSAFSTRDNASAECESAYHDLCGRTLTTLDRRFPHQFVVDAYAIQHATQDGKPIGILYPLVGMYLATEQDWNGREVQLGHQALAVDKPKEGWPRIELPPVRWKLNLAEVLGNLQEGAFYDVLRDWVVATWEDLPTVHDQIRLICKPLLSTHIRGNPR
jgi:hypothetical protein